MEEKAASATAGGSSDEKRDDDKNRVEESENSEDSKRFDEDALPVPLEEVEMLTGGVDENDDRIVEFPWDEEARRARVAPRPIKFEENITHLDCHPSENFVACAHIDGVASVHRFCLDEKSSAANDGNEEEDEDEEETNGDKEASTAEKGRHGEEVFSYLDYEEACRVVKFNRDGTKLITASAAKDVTFHDFHTEDVDLCFSDAHQEAVYAICVLSESLIASGDDAGVIKLWDVRQRKSLFSFNDNSDFISSLLNGDSDENSTRRLLATSGDGSLTSFNLRQRKIELKSEVFDTEMLCAAPIRNRSKLVTGDGNGVCNIFNWDEWGYFADKFPVSAGSSLDAMVGVTDSIVAVAGLSGAINAIHFSPNRHLGKIGVHLISATDAVVDDEEDGGGSGAGGSGKNGTAAATTSSRAPIDSLTLNHDGTILASCGHDNRVRFWSVAHLAEVDPDKLPKRKKESSKKTQLNPDAKKSAFYHDLAGYNRVEGADVDDDSDDDSDDNSDDDDDSVDGDKVNSLKNSLSAIEEEEEDDSSDDDSDSAPPPPKKKHK